MKPITPHSTPVQGEGDYKSAKRYNESMQSFVKEDTVQEAAKKVATNPQETFHECLMHFAQKRLHGPTRGHSGWFRLSRRLAHRLVGFGFLRIWIDGLH